MTRAALTLLLLAACSGPERPGTPPRNVILITVSGLRADHLSAWLYPRPTGAARSTDQNQARFALDALAQQGVAFAHAFAPSASDRESLLDLHGGHDGAPTLAQNFHRAGFRTAAFPTGAAADSDGLAQGFEHFHRGAAKSADPDREAVVAATRWLGEEALADGAPFFLWLHLSGPRAPYAPAPLGEETFAERFTDPDHAGAADGSLDYLATLGDPASAPSGEDLGHVVALYDGEVARVCQLVTVFARTLAGGADAFPHDVLAESVLVFAGTSGAELFQHGRVFEDPGSLHDASLHVPLFLRHPQSLTGRRVLAPLVELRDVAATLRDWFGLARPPAERGRSLLALTDSHVERPFERRPARAGGGAARTVRTPRWRLVKRGLALELYDLERDPLERSNVAAQHPELVRELEAQLTW